DSSQLVLTGLLFSMQFPATQDYTQQAGRGFKINGEKTTKTQRTQRKTFNLFFVSFVSLWFSSLLFVTKRYYRIHFCCPARRNVASSQYYTGQQKWYYHKCDRICRA